MLCVIINCSEKDYDELSMHLFKRQIELLFKDGKAYVGIHINTMFDLSFVSSFLHCKLLFSPFGLFFNKKWYHTLKIVREDNENTNSGN